MNPRRAGALIALVSASLPLAWAAFVSGNQLMVFTTFATQADIPTPLMGWVDLGRDALRVAAICAALLVAWRAADRGQLRTAWIAIATGWAIAITLSGGLRGFVL